MSPRGHVIWDWNGTLLDDFEITARITIEALAELGVPAVTPDQVRHHYTRPLADYFSALLGRRANADDILHLGSRYDVRYHAAMRDLPLAPDAIEAMDIVAGSATQSLLSMAPDEQLHMLVDHHALHPRFVLVQGNSATGHPTKRESLAAHCSALDLDIDRSCLIGDTVDDYESARAIGLRSILVATGMQSRQRLEATGAPVADNLRDAARLFVQS